MGETIKQLIRYIEQNISEEVNVKNLESSFNYSERHIRRLFKHNTNLSIHPYITERKMTYALFDLKANLESVKDLHLKYGYNSHDSFSRAFKRTFKVAPKHFDKLNADIILKEITPNVLAPLIYFKDQNDENHYSHQHLYWTKNENKITFKIIDVDNVGEKCINYLINYGYSPHNILKLNSLNIENLESSMSNLFSIRLESQTNENMVVVYCKEINDSILKIVDYIKNRDQMCLIIDESKYENCDVESVLYHLSIMINRSTTISKKDLKKIFNPLPGFFNIYSFDSFSSIFDYNFENDLKDFKNITISISTRTMINVDLISSIVKHINKEDKYKIQINPSISEKIIHPFQLMIFAH